MSESKKGLTIDQAKEQIAQLENAYSGKLLALQKVEKEVASATKECLEALQLLTVSQTQFFRGVIDIQNKQLSEKNTDKPATPPKKSARRDNVSAD